jgi:hypothetical protein
LSAGTGAASAASESSVTPAGGCNGDDNRATDDASQESSIHQLHINLPGSQG